MKRYIKIALCFALMGGLLILAACGRGNNGAAATFGRYVEIDISPPVDGRFISFLAADGGLVAFDEGLRNRYDSTDGGQSWVHSVGPGLGTEQFANVQTGAFLPDGRLLVHVPDSGMVAIGRDGSSAHFPVDVIDTAVAGGQGVVVSMIQVVDDERILLSYTIGGMLRQGVQLLEQATQGGIPGAAIGGGTGAAVGGIDGLDLGAIAGMFSDGEMPDLSAVAGMFGGSEMPDLSAVAGMFGGEMPDLGAIAGMFGDGESLDLSAIDLGAIDLSAIDLGAIAEMFGREIPPQDSASLPGRQNPLAQGQGGQHVQGGRGMAQRPGVATAPNINVQDFTTMDITAMLGQNATSLHEISTGQMIAELPLDALDTPMSAVGGDSYIYLLSGRGSINRFDLASGAAVNRAAIHLGGTTGLVGVMGGGALTAIGGARGNVAAGLDAVGFGMGGGSALAASSTGGLYVLHDRSILRYGNGDLYTVLDGTPFAFGAAGNSGSSLIILDCGDMVVNVLVNHQANRLFRYTWDDDAQINPERTLAIWALEDNATVRAAITEIMRMYPDAYISLEIALDGDTALSTSDAVRTLNTRMLSGRGPDILILDGTPIESYVNRGMLLNLADGVNTSDIYSNLLAPYRMANGNIYVLPTQFSLPALMGYYDALNEIQTLSDFTQRILDGNPAVGETTGMGIFTSIPAADRPEIHFDNLEELFDLMWITGSPAFIMNNQINPQALVEFLEAIDAINNMYELANRPESILFSGRMGMLSVGVRGGGMANILSGSLARYMTQTANFGALTINNLTVLQMLMIREDASLSVFPGLAPGAWEPSTMIAVSADTDAPEFAMRFVDIMLSPSVQQINHGHGLPITRGGMEAQIRTINDRLTEAGADPFDLDVNDMVQHLHAPALLETIVRDIIWQTVERLGRGNLDVEGAVREIEQNLRIYLAERS